MPNWIQAIGIVRLAAVLIVTASAGCTISIQPWTKPAPPQPPSQFHDANPLNPNMMMKNQQTAPANNEATAQMIKNLNEEQDLRKALQDQVVSLKKQIKEREDNLHLASYEMEESTKQIKRTREEFRQWQTEMEDLRERIRRLEDYRSSTKQGIEEIYRLLDREKDSPKTLKYQAPKQ